VPADLERHFGIGEVTADRIDPLAGQVNGFSLRVGRISAT